jgi:PAS domain-containing protein
MVFDNVHEGVVLIDKDGSLLDINAAAIKLHGLEEIEKESLLKQSP